MSYTDKINQFIGQVTNSYCDNLSDFSDFKNLANEIVLFARENKIPWLNTHAPQDYRILEKLPNKPSNKRINSIFEEAKKELIYDLNRTLVFKEIISGD